MNRELARRDLKLVTIIIGIQLIAAAATYSIINTLDLEHKNPILSLGVIVFTFALAILMIGQVAKMMLKQTRSPETPDDLSEPCDTTFEP